MTKKIQNPYKGNPYMMLGRLQMNCQGFIDTNGISKTWCYGSAEADIMEMVKIYNSLEEKPQWLSMKDIEYYSLKCTGFTVSQLFDNKIKNKTKEL